MKMSLYTELKWKIIFITLLVSIAPLVFLGGMIFYQFAGLCQERAKDQIYQLARTQAQALDVFLHERVHILTTLVDTVSYDELSRQASLARIFEVINRRSDGLGLVDIGVIDSKGQHLAYVGPYSLKGLNYYQQPWFSEVMARGKYISDVYLGYRQLPHFIIAVRGQSDGTGWILRATIDSDVFNRMVRTVQTGKTGDAYIVNKAGTFQTRPRLGGQLLSMSDLVPVQFGGGTTVMEIPDAAGNKKYYAGSWMKDNEWLLVVSQESCDEKGRLIAIRNRDILIVGLGCAAIILATVLSIHMLIRRLEENDAEMNRLNAELVQSDKLAAMGKMAAGIAHEINNPLAVIGEKAGWMKDLLEEEEFHGSPNLKEYAKSVEKIEHHVDRARKVTHNLLGFARRMEPHLDDVDVNVVLKETIEFLEHHARINNIEIRKDFQEDLPIIASDQSQLQQVFLNLITNAIDAIGDNGAIDIETRKADSHIGIRIRDDGPGIPKEKLSRIFDPFFTTKQPGQGTGLGLSISHSIIEKMGGAITCNSTEKMGTTFEVLLPIVIPEKK